VGTKENKTRRSGGSARLWRDERGGVAPLIAGGAVMLLGFLALAVDGGMLYGLRNRMQATADAAALAGASQLPNEIDARALAQSFAGKNMPADQDGNGTVLAGGDVSVGRWNWPTRTFTANLAPLNAVRVIVRRTQATGNPAPTVFARVLGWNTVDITTVAIATGEDPGMGDCNTSGIITRSRFYMNSNNDFMRGACVFAEDGATINANNRFEPGTHLGMLDVASGFAQGANNDIPGGTLYSAPMPAPFLAPEALNIVTGMRAAAQGAGGAFNLPDYVSKIETVQNMPAQPEPGTVYIVDGQAKVVMNDYVNGVLKNVLHDMVIVASGGIEIPSNLALNNVMLIANGNIDIASNSGNNKGEPGTIGDPNFCQNGNGAVQMVTPANLTIDSNRDIYGAQMIVGGEAMISSNSIIEGLSLHAEGDINLPDNNQNVVSNIDVIGCARKDHLYFGPGASLGPKLRLVS
jgi:Flp pilus assembly protein TadG